MDNVESLTGDVLRNVRRAGRALAGALPLLLLPTALLGQGQGRVEQFRADFVTGFRGTVHTLLAPTRWSVAEWAAVPATGIALATLSGVDDPVHDAVARNRTPTEQRVLGDIEPFGTKYAIGAVVGTYLAGLALDRPGLRRTGVEAATSSVVAAGIVTPALKRLVGRTRPWGGKGAFDFHSMTGNESFPSGHTTQAFAAASVLAAEAHPLWAKAGIYALAGAVGAARIVHDAHFLSDVVAGATIGTVTGRSVVHWTAGQGRPAIAPYLGTGGAGIELRF